MNIQLRWDPYFAQESETDELRNIKPISPHQINESQYIKEIEGNPIDALNALMEEHGLKQSDLSEIGSQGVVSGILFGKRQLNVRQIQS
jgi:antitoxin component HigA of HigAB toxin-antitoxin module